MSYTKQALLIVSASAGGFFLGSYLVLGYVAQSVILEPRWYGGVETLSWLAFVCSLSAGSIWLLLDLHQQNRIDLTTLGEHQ